MLFTRGVCLSYIQRFLWSHQLHEESKRLLHCHHRGPRAGTYCLRYEDLQLCIHTGIWDKPEKYNIEVLTLEYIKTVHVYIISKCIDSK